MKTLAIRLRYQPRLGSGGLFGDQLSLFEGGSLRNGSGRVTMGSIKESIYGKLYRKQMAEAIGNGRMDVRCHWRDLRRRTRTRNGPPTSSWDEN
jgi:hypothetical protein